MTTTIQKWGNSRGIRIPKYILDETGWNGNEELVLKAEKNRIIIEKTLCRKNIKELFENFNGEYTPEKIDWGKPVGDEIW